MGKTDYWLILPGLAFKAVNHNDVTVDQVTQAACICYLCGKEKKVTGKRPCLPRRGKPCSTQRSESL